MINYNKDEIKEQITKEQIYNLLLEWGGEPEYTNFGILSSTICHNPPGVGSRKLYWYANSNLFRCYTGCDEPTFDIYELVRKVMKIQKNQIFNLRAAIQYVATYLGFNGTIINNNTTEDDYEIYLSNRVNDTIKYENNNSSFLLKKFDPFILKNLNYTLHLKPWLDEGIAQEIIDHAQIGYYLGGDQITIPHFDIDGNFIGLRGRSLCQQDCELYGKYRPVIINQQLYNHPLGLNLYNLNYSKNNIKRMGVAIVFEGEKSVLLYQSYYGLDNDIAVACCGSNLSFYQIELLLRTGASEIVIAFDRQFKEIGDKEFLHLKNNLLKIWEKYHNDVKISFIFDKHMITDYKDSPIDKGPDKFLKLYKERIFL